MPPREQRESLGVFVGNGIKGSRSEERDARHFLFVQEERNSWWFFGVFRGRKRMSFLNT